MAGAILENLSGRKLLVLVSILIISQIICFLIGGLIAPNPSSADIALASKCFDAGNYTDKWFYPRGQGKCHLLTQDDMKQTHLANQIVFAFQLPLPRDNLILDYSRWQQNLIGVLQFDIEYHKESEMAEKTTVTIDAKLAYRDKGDKDTDWKYYASSREQRTLECTIKEKKEGYYYSCSIVPIFELGSLHHDYYLLDLRLPVDDNTNMNSGLGQIVDIWLVAINQNGGFTKVWLSLKTIFFPVIVGIMVWFWNRVHQLNRPPALLEQMLLFLGCSLTVLNLPLEYLTLAFDMPYMSLIGDIRQGVFYASLLSFWLVFAGEHLMENEDHNTLRAYWKHLSAVVIGCISLFVFDVCERGVQLSNPFYSIWVTSVGTNLALTFIIMAGISAGIYFLFLSYMIWKVFNNISTKRASLPSMSGARRLHYEGVIYRFKFLMLATLLCAAMTVVGFILGQVSEGRWKWDEDIELEYTSAFFSGVYGMWNIYIFALIVLYSPSHKQWPQDDQQSMNEEIEFSRLPTEPSEISSLTSFARKTAMD
ncbi:protein wntless isoform X2 [Neocloeon triangulifer]|uniref:protein wntless isoform X2 n=1 Tax=Neocloeon triangulifer TaxID=2078957 RepID=UPI00286F342B|nr:protein wntless isoform X2 [Neocloeon triangulifer]